MFKFPVDNSQFSWTRHIKNKMVFYNLSGAQILRVFRFPERREEGIAPKTAAAMRTLTHNKQRTMNNPKKPSTSEIWIMYQSNKQRTMNNQQKSLAKKKNSSMLSVVSRKLSVSRVTLISAWRYPGKTKPGAPIPIPQDILEELSEII